jgi:DUF3035 family protein
MRNPSTSASMKVAAIACAGFVLVGCQALRQALGIHKSSPNEFAVVSHAPLVVPPDLTLRPPRPGALPRFEYEASEEGKRALFPQTAALPPAQKNAGYSDTEILVLRKSNALDSDSGVRGTLASETGLDAKVPQAAKTIPVSPKPSGLRVANLGTVIGAKEIAQPVLRFAEDGAPAAPSTPEPAMQQIAADMSAPPAPPPLLRRRFEN